MARIPEAEIERIKREVRIPAKGHHSGPCWAIVPVHAGRGDAVVELSSKGDCSSTIFRA